MKQRNKPIKNKFLVRILLVMGLFVLSLQEAYFTINRADDFPLSETVEGLMMFIGWIVFASSMLVFTLIEDSLDKREKHKNSDDLNP